MRLKLKELRERNGWTQDQVASRAGMSKSFYSEIESGKKAANSRRLQKFAEVFQVSTFELIDDASVDAELFDHLQVLQGLTDQDRAAVIRHALGLAADKD
ncbi:helix-turn-helix domain-containing protein [Falsirhodobacter sp. 20TX0035]|uniref:helix-turn-helix domain-containing protein n=1 Tax=Falsirhodobacter sp. 20TX0035 TaxID=3022019 RepID=UPI002330A03E|nr:helix-turn-helix transcriptional regulator [Falsirhodobacter sp. 20TX0035]MDB6454471.1 helix-turn-helix transcriptional regulator [Falsirhodobacter sp. 20TX0035]